MSADISVRLTAAVRAADSRFESVGGSSRWHYVNDCLLPALEAGRLAVVDALVPQHLKSAECDVNSLGDKLAAAEHMQADLLAACEAAVEELRGDENYVGDNGAEAEFLVNLRAAIAEARGGK